MTPAISAGTATNLFNDTPRKYEGSRETRGTWRNDSSQSQSRRKNSARMNGRLGSPLRAPAMRGVC